MTFKVFLLFFIFTALGQSKILIKNRPSFKGERKLDLFGGPPDETLENEFQHTKSLNSMKMMMTNLRLDQQEQDLLQSIDGIADAVDQIAQEAEPKLMEVSDFLDYKKRGE